MNSNLLSVETKVGFMLVTLSGNYQSTTEYAARCCYNSERLQDKDTWRAFLKARLAQHHESVIDHSHLTLTVITDEMLRSNIMNVIYRANNLVEVEEVERGEVRTNGREGAVVFAGNLKMWRDVLKNMDWDNFPDECEAIYGAVRGILSAYNSDEVYCVDCPTHNVENAITPDLFESTKLRFVPKRNFRVLMHQAVEPKPIEKIPVKLHDDTMKLDIINVDMPSEVRSFFKEAFNITGVGKEAPGDASWIVDAVPHMFGSVTYRVKTARIISQQDSRHRKQGQSQMSQRYCKMGRGTDYYRPTRYDCEKPYAFKVPVYENGVKTEETMEIHLSYDDFQLLAKDGYDALFNDGWKAEDARFTCTNAEYTEYVLTKPFYTIQHFFNERSINYHAQYEMKVVAQGVNRYLNSMENLGIKFKDIPEEINLPVEEEVQE